MEDKKLQQLKSLLELANTDYATRDETAQILAEFAKTLKEFKSNVADTKSSLQSDLHALTNYVDKVISQVTTDTQVQLKDSISNLVSQLVDMQKQHDTHVTNMESLAKQIDDVSGMAITGLEASKIALEAVKSTIPIIPAPDTGAVIIDKINADDTVQIKQEKVEGLTEFVNKKVSKSVDKAVGANRNLYQLLDVNVSGVTTDQSIKWDGRKWIPFTPGTGGGVQSVVAGTNVTVDNTDPQNPIVSATGGAGAPSAWMPPETPAGLINGSNVTYTLSYIPSAYSGILTINGKMYEQDVDWTISGSTITFTTALVASLSDSDFVFKGQLDTILSSNLGLQTGDLLLQDDTELLLN